ncbi:MAG: hypothetical protein AAGF12_19245 [Myxococcota bacterium]
MRIQTLAASRVPPRTVVLPLLFASIIGLAFVPQARATTVAALDLVELVRRSDKVVSAVVVGMETRYDARRRIVTDVTVEVAESMKGGAQPGERIVVRCLGGEVGDVGMRVPGEPRFEVGDETMLFLRMQGGVHRAVGMSQGVLPIRLDDRGYRMALPGGEGLHLVRPASRGQLQHAPGALVAPVPLHELTNQIRTLVDGQRLAPRPAIEEGRSLEGR